MLLARKNCCVIDGFLARKKCCVIGGFLARNKLMRHWLVFGAKKMPRHDVAHSRN
jgi:hypothetical protein